MTDLVNEVVETAPVEQAAPKAEKPSEEQQEQQEKTFTQEEVNSLVGKNKSQAYEKGKRDALDELQRVHASQQQQNGKDPLEMQLEQKVAQTMHKMKEAEICNSFMSALKKEMDSNPEAAEVAEMLEYNGVPMGKIPAEWVDSVNNDDKFLKSIIEVTKTEPDKMANILNMANVYGGKYALKKFKDLSSAKEKAKQSAESIAKKQPKDPLSQMSSSNIGAGNDSLTVRDLKMQDWLRG